MKTTTLTTQCRYTFTGGKCYTLHLLSYYNPEPTPKPGSIRLLFCYFFLSSYQHQQNVKTGPDSSWSNTQLHGPHGPPDPPSFTISRVWLHEVDQAGSRWPRNGPGACAGLWCLVVDQWCSGPPWST